VVKNTTLVGKEEEKKILDALVAEKALEGNMKNPRFADFPPIKY